MSEPIHLVTGSNILNYSLGLEINKTYKLEGYVGEESNTYSATFTPVDFYEFAESDGLEGEELEEVNGIIATFEEIRVPENEFPNLPFNLTFDIFDNCNKDTYQGEVMDFTENACTVDFYGSDPDTTVNNANVMLTSITEVEEV